MIQNFSVKIPLLSMRFLKYKCFISMLVFTYLLLFYLVFNLFKKPDTISFVNLNRVVVHIDLKGAPPKLQYLEGLLPLFSKHRVNGILLEYEDMFPYEGKLVNLSSSNCYNRSELKNFLLKVKENQIEVIPLIQTIGHMEYVLKLPEFRHLREIDTYPDSICPSNQKSVELVQEMLEQVINFHQSIADLNHIHIGGDEVFHINKCQLCRRRRISRFGIFIKHIQKLSQIVFNINPETTVLIWHDMLTGIKKYRWKNEIIRHLHNVEPVYWDYTTFPDIVHLDLYHFHQMFSNIWVASAFKGADGRQAALPDFKSRFINHHSWMSVLVDYMFAGEKTKFDFKGIILTGWSRYSHMDSLCELFPSATPSLILNLLLIQKYRQGVTTDDKLLDANKFFLKYIEPEFHKELHCKETFIDIDDLDILSHSCKVESRALLKLLKQHKALKFAIESTFNHEKLGLSSIEYNIKTKNFNMNELNKTILICENNLRDLFDWNNSFSKEMAKVFDKHVVQEYVEQKIYSVNKKLEDTLKLLEDYSEIHTWERRPFNNANIISVL